MEGDPSFGVTVFELDIQGRHVSLEGQSRGRLLCAIRVIDGVVRGTDGKLTANSQVGARRNFARDPSCEAIWITVVRPLGGVGVVDKGAMKIELFAGVIFVNVLAVTRNLIRGIFDRVNAASVVLRDADRVAKAPTKAQAIRVEVVRIRGDIVQVKDTNLGMAFHDFRVSIAVSEADQSSVTGQKSKKMPEIALKLPKPCL